MPAEQVSILFADISGFSKLSTGDMTKFVKSIMPNLAKVIATSKTKPRILNTWGDAIFLVFATASAAAICALELRDRIRSVQWLDLDLATDLKIRIALHNAVVMIEKDPITKRDNAYGREVNLAARIEPIVLANEVFATHEFKIALDAAKMANMEWEDLGVLSLAKDWGTSRVYRLRKKGEILLTGEEFQDVMKKADSLSNIMKNASKLVEPVAKYHAELRDFLTFVDEYLLHDGIFKKTWHIQVTYNTGRLKSDGVVIETILFRYELINLNIEEVEFVMEVFGGEEETEVVMLSLNRIEKDGTRTSILETENHAERKLGVESRKARLKLPPVGSDTFEMVYKQPWHVNKEKPVIHNNFPTRHVSLRNTIEFLGPIKKVTIFCDFPCEPLHWDEDKISYTIPGILSRDMSIEYEVEIDLERL